MIPQLDIISILERYPSEWPMTATKEETLQFIYESYKVLFENEIPVEFTIQNIQDFSEKHLGYIEPNPFDNCPTPPPTQMEVPPTIIDNQEAALRTISNKIEALGADVASLRQEVEAIKKIQHAHGSTPPAAIMKTENPGGNQRGTTPGFPIDLTAEKNDVIMMATEIKKEDPKMGNKGGMLPPKPPVDLYNKGKRRNDEHKQTPGSPTKKNTVGPPKRGITPVDMGLAIRGAATNFAFGPAVAFTHGGPEAKNLIPKQRLVDVNQLQRMLDETSEDEPRIMESELFLEATKDMAEEQTKAKVGTTLEKARQRVKQESAAELIDAAEIHIINVILEERHLRHQRQRQKKEIKEKADAQFRIAEANENKGDGSWDVFQDSVIQLIDDTQRALRNIDTDRKVNPLYLEILQAHRKRQPPSAPTYFGLATHEQPKQA